MEAGHSPYAIHRNQALWRAEEKLLTQQLRELELDGIVIRTVYPEVPPRVEYSLSVVGISLVPVIDSLYQWGEAYSEIMGKPPGPMTVDNAASSER
jgi:DNA-binding HxlR family transcriptional regulator